jgi:hypothetical protein
MTAGHFELLCTITLAEVPEVRRFVEKLHRRIVRNHDDVSRLTMATHELLENAVKFSVNGSAMLRIRVDGEEICVTTRNLARTADVEGLISTAREIKAAPNAMAFYLGLMARAPRGRGGLGLGRIAAEGEMQIGLEVENDVVEISAKSRLVEPIA